MNGLDPTQLAAVSQELKEAVCNAIVSKTIERISGAGPEGVIVYGLSPRRSIVSGQLLPRFDPTGQDDETSDIRIAAIGIDFHTRAASRGDCVVVPTFCVYVRVMPLWSELTDTALDLEIPFKLQGAVQATIDARIRQLRTERFQAASLATPDWPNLNPAQRQQVRERRSVIQEEVRRLAYQEVGIRLEEGDEPPLNDRPADATDGNDNNTSAADAPDADANRVAQLRLGRLLQRGRTIPFALLDPAAVPPKWRRLDLTFDPFSWPLDASRDALATRLDDYNNRLRQSAVQQITNWIQSPEGLRAVWRDVRVQPQDSISETAWQAFLDRVATIPAPVARLMPSLDVSVQIDRTPDFVDPERLAIRVTLDNAAPELSRRDASTRTDALFQTGISVQVPAAAHLPLRLDRVEPSYRFRHFLEYPAIGLNCGVGAQELGDALQLQTAWAPRFVQPRIIPRELGGTVPVSFSALASEQQNVSNLLPISEHYIRWTQDEETRLREAVREDLEEAEADRETERLQDDLRDQRREAGLIERGIRLLAESQQAYRLSANERDPSRRAELGRRAAPYRAWQLTNQSFLERENGAASRGWRLFQLAFILAHVPTFASRMDEFRSFHDPAFDETAASLLYFPTGGGKSEAFYGALLFAMFLDRLRGKSRGVTALIRYPLRLLTLQQGQRLLKLLAHAEIVRRRTRIGHWPFEIGFWVGGKNTPNRYAYVPSVVPLFGDTTHPDDARLEENFPGLDAEGQRDSARYREFRSAFNKVPHCPVCARATGLRRYDAEGPTARRLTIVCFNPGCALRETPGQPAVLPFILTDDTIYARAPSVVLGTIDKLAMLGQRTTTIRPLMGMFGLARGIGPSGHLSSPPNEGDIAATLASSGHAPVFPAFRNGERVFFDPFPALVVQDEAHLLEESLGTFSGLFDSLLEQMFRRIDAMAGTDLDVARVWQEGQPTGPRMPKYIAATATISNPDRQLEVLYQRAPLRFPCPGSDIYHSFFSSPAPAPAENPNRRALEARLDPADTAERTAPWMRLFVSVMTNDATHTVTAVAILGAFHSVITTFWRGLLDPTRRQAIIDQLILSQGNDEAAQWRRQAIERCCAVGSQSQLLALVDLHRIALAYVTNKKGGDQVMDALDPAVRQRHRQLHEPLEGFVSRLISGGIDMTEIQEIMELAQTSAAGRRYDPLDSQLRTIVATSAISHGVDVDRFNSMFFAGLPSDIAEYIQASSRVGRTHVGFVMLIPTPQSRRDRYVVETHDIFHRFLERMIAPPAVERWAENAIRRVLASIIQAWAVLRENEGFIAAPDNRKARTECFETIQPIRALIRNDPTGFINELGSFTLNAVGFPGRPPTGLGSPVYQELYRALIDRETNRFVASIRNFETPIRLFEYWDDSAAVYKPPMTSLRDVDEAGLIVPAAFDARVTRGGRSIAPDDLLHVMRAIRQQRGVVAETDGDGAQRGASDDHSGGDDQGANQGWRNRAGRRRPPAATSGNNPSDRGPTAPTMSRSRIQLATTYAPGVLFTWEGARGICRSVPVDRGELRVADATRLLIFDGVREIASSWLVRGRDIWNPGPTPIELVLDDAFYDPRSHQVDRDWAREFQLCDPGAMGYVPYPLLYRCAICSRIREYESIADQARDPLPPRCGDHSARWSQVDVVYVHWSGNLEPLSPYRNNFDATRGQVNRLQNCQCGGREFLLQSQGSTFSEWQFICESCRTPRDLKQPDPRTYEILEREKQRGGRNYEFIEVNMQPASYRANYTFYPQKGTFIEFRERSVVELLLPQRQGELLQRLAQIHGFPYSSPTDEAISAALVAANRGAEWDDYLDRVGMADRATARGQTGRADVLRREAAALREAWFDEGVIDRGQIQSQALIAAVLQRGGWARRFDPIRLTIEHDRFCAEHINERRAQHESINVMEPDRLICDAVGDPDALLRYQQTIAQLLNRIGLAEVVLIRGLPICEFSFGFSRVSSSPVYHREFNGRQVPMPVRLNAFPELPTGRRPIYVTQQRNEALYFRLDESRVRRWLTANNVELPDDFADKPVGASYLENYDDFGSFLDDFKSREGRIRSPRSLTAYIYLLLHSLSHQVMHSLADVSGLDRDGLGELIFPADLTFVIYRKGMTPDLGNISAMWRNHSSDFLRRVLDQRLLRCGSGSLCDTRGGACPACVMVSEVTCIGGNQLLSRSSLKGGPAPAWEPQGSEPLVGYFERVLADG